DADRSRKLREPPRPRLLGAAGQRVVRDPRFTWGALFTGFAWFAGFARFAGFAFSAFLADASGSGWTGGARRTRWTSLPARTGVALELFEDARLDLLRGRDDVSTCGVRATAHRKDHCQHTEHRAGVHPSADSSKHPGHSPRLRDQWSPKPGTTHRGQQRPLSLPLRATPPAPVVRPDDPRVPFPRRFPKDRTKPPAAKAVFLTPGPSLRCAVRVPACPCSSSS